MTLTLGPNLGLLCHGDAGDSHLTEILALFRGVDFFGMARVLGYLTNTPPGSPADGDAYIIGAAPTGAWAAQGGKIARYNVKATAWEFFTPKEGWLIQRASTNVREIYRYTNSTWEIFYGEGTFTPTVSGSTTAGTQTYGTQEGSYTKVGRQITFQALCILTAKGTPAGNLLFSGLPFYAAAAPTAQTVGVFANTLANASYLCAQIVASTSSITFFNNLPSAAAAQVTVTDLQANTGLRVAGSYFI